MRNTTFTGKVILASFAAIITAPDILQAETKKARLTSGALTEDYFGRSERYSSLGFNGVSFSAQQDFGRMSVSGTLGLSKYGDLETLSNYEVSLALGESNWQIGVGKIDRNWSPSQYTSLILSRNAPSVNSIFIRKSDPSATDFPILRWLGDWDGEFFIGTTDDIDQPDNALLMGMRARIRPIQNLELDFVRTAQWGGAGQPQDLKTFFRILTGRTNEGAARGANQMAGIGISYTLPTANENIRIYYQGVGEDEAGYLPSCLMHMGGIEFDTHLFGVRSEVTLEHTDTRIAETSAGWCGPNTAYRNNSYSYVHNGKSIGAAIDSESRSTNLRVMHDLDEVKINWSISHYIINDKSLSTHRLSDSRTEGLVTTFGFTRDFYGGKLSALIAYQNFELNSAGFDQGTRLGVSFEKSF